MSYLEDSNLEYLADTPWSRVLLEELILTRIVKKSSPLPPVTEPEGSLLCSQEPATGPY
jgi:hypothetical protein